MKTMLALFAVLCCAVGAFAQDNHAVVRWKTIVGNITVSNNDAVGESTPGPLLGARSAEGLASI